MTDRADDDAADPATLANNQHHQGVDWVYGGWDRDAMQGDLSDNGPHTVVQGTHQRVPKALSTDGRKDDDLVRSSGLWDKVIELTGPAGTFMAVDTAGLHKGQPPITGDRCVLQVEFATSLFGAPVDYPVFTMSELAAQRYREMPQILQRWRRAASPTAAG